MTRAPGTHAKTRAGIANALGAGLVVTLTCVVERRNVEGLADQARDIVRRFVEPFPNGPLRRATYAHPTGYSTAGLWQASQVPFDVSRPHLVEAGRILHEAGVPLQITGTCGFPLCVLSDAPELIDAQVLKREIFDAEQLVHLHHASVCDGCARKRLCFGLRSEYLETFGERGLVPFDS